MNFLQGIRITIATTPNFINGFLMHVSGKPRIIKFRRSPPILMTPFEYFNLKQPVYHGYSINKYGDEWEISKDCVRLRTVTKKFSHMLWDEILLSHYGSIDFKGKTVLDVGGYVGDSAVLFHHLGAEKIIIYEPVEEHIHFIKENIELNHINADIKNLGIGPSKGSSEIPFHELDLRFGLDKEDHTLKKRTIFLEDIATAILESHADIAKFNCEGCEEAILFMSTEVIRKIPIYVVEMHGEDLERQLLDKFNEAGFEKTKSSKPKQFYPLYTLSRK